MPTSRSARFPSRSAIGSCAASCSDWSATPAQSTGPHLHFAIQIGGGYIDPLPWMLVHVNT